MSWINTPTPRWLLVPVSDAGHPGIRYAAIAPGCDYQPHDTTQCGCRRFAREADGKRYIRDQSRR
jgi:hypothetical protein